MEKNLKNIIYIYKNMGFPSGSDSKESTCNMEDLGLIPGLGRSLEDGMAIHSSIFAWIIPWTEEPGRGYSPWGHKESDTTERLSTSYTRI